MGKLTISIIATVVVLIAVASSRVQAASDCPSYSKVQNCSPKCLQDSECSAIGGKCCPNLCNSRSCVQPNQLGNNNDNSKYGGNKGGGTGSYCGNVKCNSYEKCDLDRATKRMKCVRA